MTPSESREVGTESDRHGHIPSPPPGRAAFREAAGWFLEVVAGISGDQWDQPGLGEWSVRELVAHTSRAFTTIEEYLATPATVEIDSAAEYFRQAVFGVDVHAAIAERGRTEVRALGDDTAGAVRALAERVLALVDRTPDDTPCATRAGGMRVGEYLRTRTLELTIHSLDLAAALSASGDPAEPPPAASTETLVLLAEIAALGGGAERATVLRALTGRSELPPGYNAIG